MVEAFFYKAEPYCILFLMLTNILSNNDVKRNIKIPLCVWRSAYLCNLKVKFIFLEKRVEHFLSTFVLQTSTHPQQLTAPTTITSVKLSKRPRHSTFVTKAIPLKIVW